MNLMGKNFIFISAIMFALFCLITSAVKNIDVKPIGPLNTKIGLSTINKAVKDFFGVNMKRYKLTDMLGWLAIFTAAGFGLLGFIQLIKTKSLFKVDRDIILLGVFYIIVMATYGFFEKFIVNYRPVLIKNKPEASFPSSHTMVVVFVMATAIFQFNLRIQNPVLCTTAVFLRGAVAVVTVTGRMISGAHWITDIIAGLLLSGSFVCLYIGLRSGIV